MVRFAEPLHLRRCQLGEGPLWDPRRERILWVDITAGLVFACDLDGQELGRLDLDTDVGFVALRRSGGFLAATRDGFQLIDPDGEVAGRTEVDPDPDRRFNDGASTPAGTVLAGTMAYDAAPDAGTIWSFDGRHARPVLDGVTVSNGMAWSADGRTLYYVDSSWSSIDAFDYEPDPDRLSNRRSVFHVPDRDGSPDGLTIDADGCLWLALYGGAQVLRISPEGSVLDRVVVPAPNVTSMAFAGPRLDRLVITTAAQGMRDDEFDAWPRAGALFVADPGVTGVVEHTFAG